MSRLELPFATSLASLIRKEMTQARGDQDREASPSPPRQSKKSARHRRWRLTAGLSCPKFRTSEGGWPRRERVGDPR
jgi:hypothetical protein